LRRLMIVAAFALLAAPATASASASRQVDLISVDSTFQTDSFCSFPLTEHQSGTYQVATFFDTAGDPTKAIITVRSHYTVSLSGNGKTLSGVQSYAEMDVFNSDGDTVSVARMGVIWQFRIPGGGLVLVETGRIVYDEDGNVVFEAGPHPVSDGATEALCNYFSS
jgi:hypothetical protein